VKNSGEDGKTMAELDSLSGKPLAADVYEYNTRVSRWKSGFDT
jgi:hypothetical protein